jgi:hypothetical protein
MVFNATFKNISVISWRTGLLVKDTPNHGIEHTDLMVDVIGTAYIGK